MSDCQADHERPSEGDLPVVFTVSGLCGSAKTFTATRWAHARARWGAKVLIAQPSKKLVDQTMADLRSLGGAAPARAVHEGTCDGPVRTLVRHTEEAGEGGEVLLATQAALARMPHFRNPGRWDLVLDEIPDAAWERNLEVPETAGTFRALFADHVEAVPEDALYGARAAAGALRLPALRRGAARVHRRPVRPGQSGAGARRPAAALPAGAGDAPPGAARHGADDGARPSAGVPLAAAVNGWLPVPVPCATG
jgi:hypothetical protein